MFTQWPPHRRVRPGPGQGASAGEPPPPPVLAFAVVTVVGTLPAFVVGAAVAVAVAVSATVGVDDGIVIAPASASAVLRSCEHANVNVSRTTRTCCAAFALIVIEGSVCVSPRLGARRDDSLLQPSWKGVFPTSGLEGEL